jgi:hypothetical protein
MVQMILAQHKSGETMMKEGYIRRSGARKRSIKDTDNFLSR